MEDLSKMFESLVLEMRPRLQSVNVFGTFKENCATTKIELNSNGFRLVYDKKSIFVPLPPNLEIITTSLNCLERRDRHISFRFSTNRSTNFGNFKSEFLANRACFSPKSKTTHLQDLLLSPDNYPLTIKCKTCQQCLAEKVNFRKMLPLPSENFDPRELFCHAPPAEHETPYTLKTDQILIGESCAHVKGVLSGVRETEKSVICKRCFNNIGNILRDRTVRMWFSSILLSNKKYEALCSDDLDDAFVMIINILNNSFVGSVKILMECRISDAIVNYLFLWIIDKDLPVHFLVTPGGADSSKVVAKVLYKFQTCHNEAVEEWLNDLALVRVDISKPVMSSLLKHLFEMKQYVPQSLNVPNAFYISYLKLYL